MNDLIQYAKDISHIDEMAENDLLAEIKTKTFDRNEYLLKPDEVCKYFYFIEEGLVKSFSHNRDKEFIMAFFQENMMFTELSSYLARTPSKYMIVALEKTTVSYIHQNAIERLSKKHHCIETWTRKLYAMTSVCFMDRISEMLEEDAKERYDKFINNYPSLVQRITLSDLASYIGINRVSLSRIRAAR